MIEPIGRSSQTDTESSTCSLHASTLSSEIDDYHISHDIDLTSDEALTMFSTSDEELEPRGTVVSDTETNEKLKLQALKI